jgi:hypothetical protein
LSKSSRSITFSWPVDDPGAVRIFGPRADARNRATTGIQGSRPENALRKVNAGTPAAGEAG